MEETGFLENYNYGDRAIVQVQLSIDYSLHLLKNQESPTSIKIPKWNCNIWL